MNASNSRKLQVLPVQSMRKRKPGRARKQARSYLQSGDPCPRCGEGNLDYDGLLNLSCPKCNFSVPGMGGGCT